MARALLSSRPSSVRHLCVIPILLAGCATFEPARIAALPTAAQYPSADAVLLTDDIEVRYSTDPLTGRLAVDETVHVRALILREGGERVAQVRVPYNPTFSSLASFEARTIAGDGRERRFRASDGVDAPQLGGFELYSDDRALSVQLTPHTPQTFVEYRYRRHYHDSRMATFAQHFEGRYPEQQARLVVVAPSGWKIESGARRNDEPLAFPPTVSHGKDVTTYVWERRDMAEQPSEPLAPARFQTAMMVAVRLARWTEHGAVERAPADERALSAWMYALTRAPSSGDATGALARELVASLPNDPTAQARRLYSWVRDHISYCAVEIGLGAWRPHAAADVFRHRYGDCKDKANLLREMFAAVGGASDLVILYAHDRMAPTFDVLTHEANHAILRMHLRDGDVLADPTSPVTPFGALPLADQEAGYLPLTADGAAVARVPASAADDNRIEVEAELAPRDGDLVGNLRATAMGAYGEVARGALLAVRRDDQAKPLSAALGLSQFHLVAWNVDGATPAELPAPVRVKAAVRLRQAWPATPVRLISAASLVGSRVPALPAKRRTAPLVLRCREHTVDRASVALGDGFDVSLPAPTVIEPPFGRYELRWTRADGKLAVERSLVLSERVFRSTEYANVKAFFDEILAAEARLLTIRRRPL